MQPNAHAQLPRTHPVCAQGYTSLHVAAENQRINAVKRLVHHGASLWATNWVRVPAWRVLPLLARRSHI